MKMRRNVVGKRTNNSEVSDVCFCESVGGLLEVDGGEGFFSEMECEEEEEEEEEANGVDETFVCSSMVSSSTKMVFPSLQIFAQLC